MLKIPARRTLGLALAAALSLVGLLLPPLKASSAPTRARVAPAVAAELDLVRKDHGDDDDDDDHDGRDPEVLRFSTVGDSRQDPVAPDPTQLPVSAQDQHWLENTKAFSRILDTVHHQKSQLFIFNGDMIMGYGNAIVPTKTATVADIVGSDLLNFYIQYAFWRGMVSRTMEDGIYVVPVPGNHETQWKKAPDGGKHAQPANEDAWRANMGDLILDTARFTTLYGEVPTSIDVADHSAMDGLPHDQSQLSYSFDFRGIHFAVINTDASGTPATHTYFDAKAPVNWLAADLAAAQGRGVIRSFVFGHKPAFTYNYPVDAMGNPIVVSPPSGLDNFPAQRDAFWAVIEKYGATYFCGHEHIFHLMQPTAATGGHAWQILVGSGGSPFDAAFGLPTLHPDTDRSYAWVTVRVFRTGKVKITAYGFDDLYGPTRVIQKITIH
jgi:hypothetical protein